MFVFRGIQSVTPQIIQSKENINFHFSYTTDPLSIFMYIYICLFRHVLVRYSIVVLKCFVGVLLSGGFAGMFK